jgi:outer membrane receptor protein involved in Fe transport
VGLAYPLSERGVVHVSYGHFFQVPPFEYLFTNPDYIFSPERQYGRIFGHADLKPEQTVAYEIGLQQALTDAIGVNLTAYYKDIRNLLATRFETIAEDLREPLGQGLRYPRFTNQDYGQVKGFIFSFEKRMGAGWGLNVDYTFQVARGNSSDPRSAALNEQAGNEPEKQLVPLDWDRRHQLNTSLTLGTPGDWVVTVIGKLGSGLPYTPSIADERTGLANSARKPGTASFDLYATKDLDVGGFDVGLFTRVYNLFDQRNLLNVYTDTGRASPNLRFSTGEPQGLNTKEEFLDRPDFYAPPRQVQLGARVTF